jgi:glycosyltransferase involved in cell wall biosynthesis
MSGGDPPDSSPTRPAVPRHHLRRVLLWMPSGRRVHGGHVVQLEKTAVALTDAGLEAETDFSPVPTADDFDLVHGFGLGAADIRYWHSRRTPVALSTVYWERSYRMDGGRRPSARALAGRAVRSARFAHAALQGRNRLIEACMTMDGNETRTFAAFESADLLLPNATGEGESIRRDLGVTTPIHPVPNGVDPDRFVPSTKPFEDRRYVLYAGRIEPHKNQLGLITALRDSGLPLVIAGGEHPDHAGYAAECRAAGEGWVTFTGHVDHDAGGLAELYHGARVHAVPSWFETTGLVSLEAGLSGCSVVSTTRGYAREYLGDFAHYCDPAFPDSILAAVRQGWDTPPSPGLRPWILDHYTWAHVGRSTLAAYALLPG